jgi:type I restriction enzyme S subunit
MIVSIGDLITADESGFACSKGKLVEVGIKHLRPFNISSEGYLNLTEVFEVPPSEVPKGKTHLTHGDILFNNTNSVEWVGKAALIKNDFAAGWSNHITRIKLDRSKVSPEWFTYWLRHRQSSGYFAANATQWVSQAAYRVADLKLLAIDLPPLSEQKRIVNILDGAASIQHLRKAADEKLKQLIPAIFMDMFGDPAANPKGWPTRRFDEIGKVQLGRQRAPKYQTGAYRHPYMRVANVYEDSIDLSDVLSMDFDERDFAAYKLVENDILLNEGQSIELVGRPAMWRGEIANCCFQNTLVRFQADGVNVLPYYAYWLILSYYRSGVLRSISSKTSNVAHMGAGRFAALHVPCPPIDLQRRFSKLVGELEATRRANVKAIDIASAIGPAFAGACFS